jgi:hypothetical protein
MEFWTIKEKDGVFQIAGQSKRDDGGWRADLDRTIDFPPNLVMDDVIERIVAIVQEEAARKRKKS